MDKERFMATLRAWRAAHPEPREVYEAAIPRHVADSMAFSGEPVDIAFLEAQLDSL